MVISNNIMKVGWIWVDITGPLVAMAEVLDGKLIG